MKKIGFIISSREEVALLVFLCTLLGCRGFNVNRRHNELQPRKRYYVTPSGDQKITTWTGGRERFISSYRRIQVDLLSSPGVKEHEDLRNSSTSITTESPFLNVERKQDTTFDNEDKEDTEMIKIEEELERQFSLFEKYNQEVGITDCDFFPSITEVSSHLPVAVSSDSESAEDVSFLDGILDGYLGPRLVLGCLAMFYATNFPLGTIMANELPAPCVATCSRMVLAALALSPHIFKLDKKLVGPAILTGCFQAMGYMTQSLALVDTSPAKVSFLGAATVLVCPFLEWAIDRKPMSIRDAPQTYLASLMCLAGVGILELGGGDASIQNAFSQIGPGDGLALLQAIGFGTQVYMSEKMIRGNPSQALPVTATLLATTAFLSAVWCFADGWMVGVSDWQSYVLPQLLFEPTLRQVAASVVWTGLFSTALSFNVEMSALGRVASAEASVILATEPLWAALFAAVLLGEQFGINDYAGGGLMVLACFANTLNPSDFESILGKKTER